MKYVVLGIITIIFGSAVVGAETTNFRQQILPIACIYEVIDVGTQQLRYITPDTCPVDPGPPVVTEPGTDEITMASSESAVSVQPPQGYRPVVSIVRQPSPTPETGQPAATQQPSVQGTVERIDDIIVNNLEALAVFLFMSIGGMLFYALVLRRNMRNNA